MRAWIETIERALGRLRLYGWAGGIILGVVPTAGIAVIWAWLSMLPGVFIALAGLGAVGLTLFVINEVARADGLGWLPAKWRPLKIRDMAVQLYVGRISAGLAQFAEDRCVEIGVIAFNGSDGAIKVSSLEGYILLRVADEMLDSVVLPPPAFSVSSVRHSIPPQTEFLVVFEQRIPTGSVSALAASLAGDRGATFDLRNFP